MTLCSCGKNPRRAPGKYCLPCEAVNKRTTLQRKNKARDAAAPKFHRKLNAKRYIITAAQNATPVHGLFMESLKVAAAHLHAELVVIPLRYKNPTSLWSENQESEDWWDIDDELLFNGRKKLGANIVLVGDVKMQPTASSPLTGFESLTGAESCILGHTKMQFKVIPVPTGRFPKILSTTGACTVPNYTDTKAGKIGEFHHFLGAVIVELQGREFHLRQINADRTDGTFIDVNKFYTPGAVFDAPSALGLAMGDTHVRVTDKTVDRATFFGRDSMVEVLDPQTLIFHDVGDGETTNPHERKNFVVAEAKRRAGRTDVAAEVKEVAEFVNARARGRSAVIVESNHHDFLNRWALETDFRSDLKNARFLLETQIYMLESARMEPGGAVGADPFVYWLKRFGLESNVRCLAADESFRLADIECGMHGHRGPGGARGSVKNLSRLGTKNITGHGHSPAIEEGHYRVGTSTPTRLAYQHGPISSLNTHCVVYANGKRALLTVINGTWKAS